MRCLPLLLLCSALATVGVLAGESSLLYSVSSSPAAWQTAESEVAPSTPLTFFVALRQRNLAELERRFWAVSDPTSPDYLDFLSTDDIQALVSPPDSDKAVVRQWLMSLPSPPFITDFGDSLEVKTTVAGASALLDCGFRAFRHSESGQSVVRAWGDVYLPSAVAPLVSALFGVSDFPVLRYSAHPHDALQQVQENDAIIPQTIRDMYGTPANQSTRGDSNVSLGVIEWGTTQSFSPQDLDWFSGNVSLPGYPRFPDSQIVGTNVPSTSGGEASLDVDVIAGIAPSASLWFWIEAGEAWLYTFTVHFLAAATVPDVISISYGAYEGGQCFSGRGNSSECGTLGVDSAGYVHAVNVQWMKIGLRGVSIMVSSGDSGAHTRSDPNCTQPHLWADYPASSPFITSVGATQADAERYFPSNVAPACHDSRNWTCVSYGRESAVNLTRAHFTSGGGFSNISAQPEYERAAVAAFLSSSPQLPPSSYFNKSGRAYPDVSALGHNWFVVNRGRQGLSGGTSQSSPIFGSVVALLLQTFKNITGKPFGFINPLLYQMYAEQPDTFRDVVAGDNVCTEHGCHSGCTGWHATKGWDPVTGLGTPRFEPMRAYVEKLAHRTVQRKQAATVTTQKSKLAAIRTAART